MSLQSLTYIVVGLSFVLYIGMCLNFTVAISVSLVTKPPPQHIQHMVENIRVPRQMEIKS